MTPAPSPSPNGPNGSGRNPATGRFQPGWKGGTGNPYAKRVGELRSALIRALGTHDVSGIVKALVAKARKGDVAAAREVLDRVLGRPVEADLIMRIEALEHQASQPPPKRSSFHEPEDPDRATGASTGA